MPAASALSPRVLFVTNEVPCYTGGGTVIRDFNLLKQLSPSYRFTLLCFTDHQDADVCKVSALTNLCERVIMVPRPPVVVNPWLIRATLLAQILYPVPRGVQTLTPQAMRARAEALYRDMDFDAVYVNHVEMAPLFRSAGSTRRIIGQEVVAPKVKRLLATTSKPLGRLSAFAEWLKMQRYEDKLYPSVDLCVMTSSVERQHVLDRAPRAKVAVVPNGVDTTFFQPSAPDRREANSPSLLFLGSLAYPPNEDALLYFAKEIWPLIVREMPTARWLIAGRNPSREVQRLVSPNIEVMGWVADVRLPMYASSAMVVPLRSGSGTRLKILEAWAAGLPVVSTSIGAEGLDVCEGQNILLADEPQQFAAAVLRLLGSPELGQRLAVNGRRLVEEQYDWRTIAPRLDRAFQDVLAGEGRVC